MERKLQAEEIKGEKQYNISHLRHPCGHRILAVSIRHSCLFTTDAEKEAIRVMLLCATGRVGRYQWVSQLAKQLHIQYVSQPINQFIRQPSRHSEK
jgi:hypothetical protein